MDELDLYGDLDEFQEQQEKKSKELQEVEEKHQQSLKIIEELRKENKTLGKNIKVIKLGFQSLLDTARSEIKRKDKEIERLRKEKDDICFRRRVPIKSSNRDENPKSVENVAVNPFRYNTTECNEVPSTDTTKIQKTTLNKDDQPQSIKRYRTHPGEQEHATDYKRQRTSRDDEDQKYPHSSHEHGGDLKSHYRENVKETMPRNVFNRTRSRERKEYDKAKARIPCDKTSKSSESPERRFIKHSDSSLSREDDKFGNKYNNSRKNPSRNRIKANAFSKTSSKSPVRKYKSHTDSSRDKYQNDFRERHTGKIQMGDPQWEENSKNAKIERKNLTTENPQKEKVNKSANDRHNSEIINLNISNKQVEQKTHLNLSAILKYNQKNKADKNSTKPSLPETNSICTPRKADLFNEIFGKSPINNSTVPPQGTSSSSLLNNIKGILAETSELEVNSSATTSPGDYTDINSCISTPINKTVDIVSSASSTSDSIINVGNEQLPAKNFEKTHGERDDIDKCFIPIHNVQQNMEMNEDVTKFVDDDIANEIEFIQIPGLDLSPQQRETKIESKTNTPLQIEENFEQSRRSSKEKTETTTNKGEETAVKTSETKLIDCGTLTLTPDESETIGKIKNCIKLAEKITEANNTKSRKDKNSTTLIETLERSTKNLVKVKDPNCKLFSTEESLVNLPEKIVCEENLQLSKTVRDISQNLKNKVEIIESLKSGNIISLSSNTGNPSRNFQKNINGDEMLNVNETMNSVKNENGQISETNSKLDERNETQNKIEARKKDEINLKTESSNSLISIVATISNDNFIGNREYFLPENTSCCKDTLNTKNSLLTDRRTNVAKKCLAIESNTKDNLSEMPNENPVKIYPLFTQSEKIEPSSITQTSDLSDNIFSSSTNLISTDSNNDVILKSLAETSNSEKSVQEIETPQCGKQTGSKHLNEVLQNEEDIFDNEIEIIKNKKTIIIREVPKKDILFSKKICEIKSHVIEGSRKEEPLNEEQLEAVEYVKKFSQEETSCSISEQGTTSNLPETISKDDPPIEKTRSLEGISLNKANLDIIKKSAELSTELNVVQIKEKYPSSSLSEQVTKNIHDIEVGGFQEEKILSKAKLDEIVETIEISNISPSTEQVTSKGDNGYEVSEVDSGVVHISMKLSPNKIVNIEEKPKTKSYFSEASIETKAIIIIEKHINKIEFIENIDQTQLVSSDNLVAKVSLNTVDKLSTPLKGSELSSSSDIIITGDSVFQSIVPNLDLSEKITENNKLEPNKGESGAIIQKCYSEEKSNCNSKDYSETKLIQKVISESLEDSRNKTPLLTSSDSSILKTIKDDTTGNISDLLSKDAKTCDNEIKNKPNFIDNSKNETLLLNLPIDVFAAVNTNGKININKHNKINKESRDTITAIDSNFMEKTPTRSSTEQTVLNRNYGFESHTEKYLQEERTTQDATNAVIISITSHNISPALKSLKEIDTATTVRQNEQSSLELPTVREAKLRQVDIIENHNKSSGSPKKSINSNEADLNMDENTMRMCGHITETNLEYTPVFSKNVVECVNPEILSPSESERKITTFIEVENKFNDETDKIVCTAADANEFSKKLPKDISIEIKNKPTNETVNSDATVNTFDYKNLTNKNESQIDVAKRNTSKKFELICNEANESDIALNPSNNVVKKSRSIETDSINMIENTTINQCDDISESNKLTKYFTLLKKSSVDSDILSVERLRITKKAEISFETTSQENPVESVQLKGNVQKYITESFEVKGGDTTKIAATPTDQTLEINEVTTDVIVAKNKRELSETVEMAAQVSKNLNKKNQKPTVEFVDKSINLKDKHVSNRSIEQKRTITELENANNDNKKGFKISNNNSNSQNFNESGNNSKNSVDINSLTNRLLKTVDDTKGSKDESVCDHNEAIIDPVPFLYDTSLDVSKFGKETPNKTLWQNPFLNKSDVFVATHSFMESASLQECMDPIKVITSNKSLSSEKSKNISDYIKSSKPALEEKQSDSNLLSNTCIASVKQTSMYESQVTQNAICEINKYHEFSHFPPTYNNKNATAVETKDLNTNFDQCGVERFTGPNRRNMKKIITKEINIEGEIVEVVKDIADFNDDAEYIDRSKHTTDISTKTSYYLQGRRQHDEKPNVNTNDYQVSLTETKSTSEQNESLLNKEVQYHITEGQESALFEPQANYETTVGKDLLPTICTTLPETFNNTPALPSISTLSPTPPNFSGIFSKKSVSPVTIEEEFIKSKKKSPHFSGKPKEYILPAASVLCNVDNLENATKSNKKIHWELLDNKNEMTEIEDDVDIDTTDEDEMPVKKEPSENASASPKQSSLQKKLTQCMSEKPSHTETDTQTEESLLNDLKEQKGKRKLKHSKVHKIKSYKRKLAKNVKVKLKGIGVSNASTSTFIDNGLLKQKPFSTVRPKRPVGRPRKQSQQEVSRSMLLSSNLNGCKEIQSVILEDIGSTKITNFKSEAFHAHHTTFTKTLNSDNNCVENKTESVDGIGRNIPNIINSMENSVKTLSTSVEKLESCQEPCNSKELVKQRYIFETQINNDTNEGAYDSSKIYHKQDFSTDHITTALREKPFAECNEVDQKNRLKSGIESETDKMSPERYQVSKAKKLLKPKSSTKTLFEKQNKSKSTRNKAANFISLEEIGIKIRPPKVHLSSFRIPKIRKNPEDTLDNSWKLETYSELVNKSDMEQLNEHNKHEKKEGHILLEKTHSEEHTNKIVCNQINQPVDINSKEHKTKATFKSNKTKQEFQEKEPNNTKTLQDETEILRSIHIQKTGKRKLFSPDMCDERDAKHNFETTIANKSSETSTNQCLSNRVKARRKSMHVTNSGSCATSSSNYSPEPRKKSINIHRRILDSSCDEDIDEGKKLNQEKLSTNEININMQPSNIEANCLRIKTKEIITSNPSKPPDDSKFYNLKTTNKTSDNQHPVKTIESFKIPKKSPELEKATYKSYRRANLQDCIKSAKNQHTALHATSTEKNYQTDGYKEDQNDKTELKKIKKQVLEKNPVDTNFDMNISKQVDTGSDFSVVSTQQNLNKGHRTSSNSSRNLNSNEEIHIDNFDEDYPKVSSPVKTRIKMRRKSINQPQKLNDQGVGQGIEMGTEIMCKTDHKTKQQNSVFVSSVVQRKRSKTLDSRSLLNDEHAKNMDEVKQKQKKTPADATAFQKQKDIKLRRKSTNPYENLKSSGAQKNSLNPEINKYTNKLKTQEIPKDSSFTKGNSSHMLADSDSSVILDSQQTINKHRNSRNKRRIIDFSSEDDEPLVKKQTMIPNEVITPLATVGKSKPPRKRRVVKVLSTSMESPTNVTTSSQQSTSQSSPLTSPLLNHPIFNTEVSTLLALPMTPNQQDDNKFKEIDSKLHAIFQSPQYTVDYKMSPALAASNTTILPPPLNDTQTNVTIDETLDLRPDANQSSFNISEINESTASINVTATMDNNSEIKHLSLGSADYRFEKVSDNVINLFISRKRKHKRKN